jgi:hypothetical protein
VSNHGEPGCRTRAPGWHRGQVPSSWAVTDDRRRPQEPSGVEPTTRIVGILATWYETDPRRSTGRNTRRQPYYCRIFLGYFFLSFSLVGAWL